MGRSLCSPSRTQGTSSNQMLKLQSIVGWIPPILILTYKTPGLVKVEPILRIELQDTSCWAFDWANSEVVAIGCTNGRCDKRSVRGFLTTRPGVIAVYDISTSLKEGRPLGEG